VFLLFLVKSEGVSYVVKNSHRAIGKLERTNIVFQIVSVRGYVLHIKDEDIKVFSKVSNFIVFVKLSFRKTVITFLVAFCDVHTNSLLVVDVKGIAVVIQHSGRAISKGVLVNGIFFINLVRHSHSLHISHKGIERFAVMHGLTHINLISTPEFTKPFFGKFVVTLFKGFGNGHIHSPFIVSLR
jgi:hypothetical protein